MNLPTSVQKNISLKDFNTFGIEAKAQSFLKIQTIQQLQDHYANWKSDPKASYQPHFVLGGGSNVILPAVLTQCVLQVMLKGRHLVAETDTYRIVRGAAGENWHEFVRWTLDQGFGGLENLSLIPGTVGAAPIQNIGAYGVEMKDVFWELTAFDFSNGTLRVFTKEDCEFSYRDSVFKKLYIDRFLILDVSFILPKKWQAKLEYGEVMKRIEERGIDTPQPRDVSDVIIEIRQSKLPDPQMIGNVGSFFKNPIVSVAQRDSILKMFPHCVSYSQPNGDVKLAAAWLIDQCGWKGRHCGAVGVYEKQALVLVNLGGANSVDVLRLAQEIERDVEIKFGVKLEREPVFV